MKNQILVKRLRDKRVRIEKEKSLEKEKNKITIPMVLWVWFVLLICVFVSYFFSMLLLASCTSFIQSAVVGIIMTTGVMTVINEFLVNFAVQITGSESGQRYLEDTKLFFHQKILLTLTGLFITLKGTIVVKLVEIKSFEAELIEFSLVILVCFNVLSLFWIGFKNYNKELSKKYDYISMKTKK